MIPEQNFVGINIRQWWGKEIQWVWTLNTNKKFRIF